MTERQRLLTIQRNEITEHLIYSRLSRSTRDDHNKEVLKSISREELRHYNALREYTGKDVDPDRVKIWYYYLLAKVLGITFGVRLMEIGEQRAQTTYNRLSASVPVAKSIAEDEDKHEEQLLNLIDEERFRYTADMARGLNAAVVELTGAVSGLTLALQNSRLIVTAGLITGASMSLSLAGNEYLASKSGEGMRSPLRAVVYAGSTNVLTVMFLILPYLLSANLYVSATFMILNAITVIFIFTFYISVVRGVSFRTRFLEMASISLGIAALTFMIGLIARTSLHLAIE